MTDISPKFLAAFLAWRQAELSYVTAPAVGDEQEIDPVITAEVDRRLRILADTPAENAVDAVLKVYALAVVKFGGVPSNPLRPRLRKAACQDDALWMGIIRDLEDVSDLVRQSVEIPRIRRSLSERLDDFRDHTIAMNKGDRSEAEWDQWSKDQTALMEETLALPLSSENAAVRAKAVMVVHVGEEHLEGLIDACPSRSGEIVRQIIKSLAGEEAAP
jgi:hypothetical protein